MCLTNNYKVKRKLLRKLEENDYIICYKVVYLSNSSEGQYLLAPYYGTTEYKVGRVVSNRKKRLANGARDSKNKTSYGIHVLLDWKEAEAFRQMISDSFGEILEVRCRKKHFVDERRAISGFNKQGRPPSKTPTSSSTTNYIRRTRKSNRWYVNFTKRNGYDCI